MQFLSIARQYEHITRLEIPKIKHAPTSLAASLQEYLDDGDFDVNRRQYIAEQQARKGSKFEGKSTAQASKFSSSKSISTDKPAETTKSVESAKPQAKGPAPDLIDFFDSIEQNQQPMAQQPQQQYAQPPAQAFNTGIPQPYPQQAQNGSMPAQQTNPFQQAPVPQQSTNPYAYAQPNGQQQIQPQFTGAGFGGYGPQPQQQSVQPTPYHDPLQQQQQMGSPQPVPIHSPIHSPVQPQSTNPFRQSMMVTGGTNFQQPAPILQQQPQPIQQQSTNPFARSAPGSAMPSQVSSPQNGQSPFSAQPIQPQQTGTNPFALPQQQTTSPPLAAMQPMVTGSTNPFRQSQFVNQQTGQGWQTGPQGTLGGWDPNQVQTIPVFPRPGQPQS